MRRRVLRCITCCTMPKVAPYLNLYVTVKIRAANNNDLHHCKDELHTKKVDANLGKIIYTPTQNL